jgi:subtilisin family serine protease
LGDYGHYFFAAVFAVSSLFFSQTFAAEGWHTIVSAEPDLKNDSRWSEYQFGLSEIQRDKLIASTGGQVDFNGIFHRRITTSEAHILNLKSEWQLVSKIRPPQITGDPNFKDEWWQQRLIVSEAWAHATGVGVTIADCDAGYYLEEPDLTPNLLSEMSDDLADQDNPLKVDDVAFVSHGTSVVAIVSGVLDGAGVNGIAFDSKVIPLQNYNCHWLLDDIEKEEATAMCILKALDDPDGRLESFGGTSGAAPQVAATVALMLEVNPDLSPAQVKSILEVTRIQRDDKLDVGGLVNIVGSLGLTKQTQGQVDPSTKLFRKKMIEILTM